MTNHIEDLLDQATLDEQIALLAGANFWETVPVDRLGIPAMRVTDGPVGARGTDFNSGPASVNVPCSTLLAASWDPALVAEVAALLGVEARAKGARVLLAPTVNLHRTPVGGRNFECMSEDPYLTARIAVEYVRGLQAQGVASCIKHFIGNDTEFERMSIDSRIDERTMRELYMVPFEAAVRDAAVLSVMTSYNRINGPWAADSPLIADVLRGEWGFDGAVISDWMGLHSTAEGVIAGLDLEMPGPAQHRGAKLAAAVSNGEVTADQVRACARAVLVLMERTGALADGGPGAETSRDEAQDRLLVRRAAASGMVLLRNEPVESGERALPLRLEGVRRVAVIGPNAAIAQIMGGGSAHVSPVHTVHPLAALQARGASAGVEVVHAVGCAIHKTLPRIDTSLCDGLFIDYFDDPAALQDAAATPVVTRPSASSRLLWLMDPIERAGGDKQFGARLRTNVTPDVSGTWRFGCEATSPTRLFVDGIELANSENGAAHGSFYGMGKGETSGDVELQAGQTYHLAVEIIQPNATIGLAGVNIGMGRPQGGDLVADAVDVAATADVTIMIVGTSNEWESEGWDRDTLQLPGRQDELIARVAEVCPTTIVVVNAGSPITMPWLDDVQSVLMAWFPGQEMGDSLADVLFGDVEPQGRLPVTFPLRLEDTPAFEHHPGRNGVANYLEGRLIGYRWYDTVGKRPLFPFGFGLGYATVSIESATATDAGNVEVTVRNDSDRDGVQVVQVYAHRLDRSGLPPDEPDQRLVGFVKVAVAANSSASATIALDPDAYRSWDSDARAWFVPDTRFELRVGTSSRDVAVRLDVTPSPA